MDLLVSLRRPLGNQVPGSEPLAIPSSTERCETRRRPLLASCGRVPILTSCRSKTRVSHAIRVRHYETVLVVETARDSSEIFNGIILVSYRNRRARIGQAECRARTVFKLDFEVSLSLMNGFYFAMVRIHERHESSPRADPLTL